MACKKTREREKLRRSARALPAFTAGTTAEPRLLPPARLAGGRRLSSPYPAFRAGMFAGPFLGLDGVDSSFTSFCIHFLLICINIGPSLSLSEKIWVFHSAILGWSRPADRRVHHTFFFLLNFNCIFLFFVAFRRVLAIQIKWHVDRIDFFVLLVVVKD
jgi:hypothetical protein